MIERNSRVLHMITPVFFFSRPRYTILDWVAALTETNFWLVTVMYDCFRVQRINIRFMLDHMKGMPFKPEIWRKCIGCGGGGVLFHYVSSLVIHDKG